MHCTKLQFSFLHPRAFGVHVQCHGRLYATLGHFLSVVLKLKFKLANSSIDTHLLRNKQQRRVRIIFNDDSLACTRTVNHTIGKKIYTKTNSNFYHTFERWFLPKNTAKHFVCGRFLNWDGAEFYLNKRVCEDKMRHEFFFPFVLWLFLNCVLMIVFVVLW